MTFVFRFLSRVCVKGLKIELTMSYLKKKIVGKHVHSKLLITKGIDTSCSTARGCPHFEGNCP